MTALASGAPPELRADLQSHHIEGFTREGSIYFSCPLFSQITENLWMGGCPPPEGAPQFDTIIDLYCREPYKVFPNQVRVTCVMLDSHDVPDPKLLNRLAVLAKCASFDGPTLVHCQAGLNRSGLITALALTLFNEHRADPIAHLRERRSPAVLCNAAFERFIREHYYPKVTAAD